MTSDGTSTGTLPAGSFYGNREAIQSCQDLAATAAQAGTPCYDETAVAPGAVFIYTAYNISTAVISAYPFQLGAVPMSIAFATANAQNLFAQNILPTPTTMATLNTAAAGITAPSPLDGIIKFTYTISSVYGAVLDNCNIGLTDANNTIVLRAEQSPRGLTSRQTSCTFTTSGLYSGSLAKPAVAFGGSGSYKSVATEVLGNQAVTGSSY